MWGIGRLMLHLVPPAATPVPTPLLLWWDLPCPSSPAPQERLPRCTKPWKSFFLPVDVGLGTGEGWGQSLWMDPCWSGLLGSGAAKTRIVTLERGTGSGLSLQPWAGSDCWGKRIWGKHRSEENRDPGRTQIQGKDRSREKRSRENRNLGKTQIQGEQRSRRTEI